MIDLVERILALHRTLTDAELPHAFGGALALAWCTQQARGTIDIDLNVLLPQAQAETLLAALPEEITVEPSQREQLLRDGQVRLWWDQTPVDLFLNNTDFHDELLQRIRFETFAGQRLPFLSCFDLAVFKAFFNRTKDWADLEAMRDAGTLPIERVQAVLIRYLGVDDERIARLGALHHQS